LETHRLLPPKSPAISTKDPIASADWDWTLNHQTLKALLTQGLVNQQPVLRRQNHFKLVNALCFNPPIYLCTFFKLVGNHPQFG